jgi:hypothetical protein
VLHHEAPFASRVQQMVEDFASVAALIAPLLAIVAQ